jgi:hypothetical protein
MLPYSNIALIARRFELDSEHEPMLPATRGSLLLTLLPVALVVLWAAVLIR